MIDQEKNEYFENNYATNLNEINLISFLQIFIRKRILISSFAIGGFVFSCIYALSIPRVWQGKFQMILGQNHSSNSSSSVGSSNLNQLRNFGLGGLIKQNNNLQSELKIITSPYVLNSAFNFVKSYKIDNQENIKDYRFDEWLADHIRVEIENETNILSFRYEDTNKEFINKVLEKIIKDIKDYSIAYKEKELKDQIYFLENQINIHKARTKNSYNTLDKYTLDNNLTVNENLQLTQENIRIKNRDQIYLIKQLLNSYSNKPDLKSLIFSLPKNSPLLEEFSSELRNIEDINLEIIRLETIYKSDKYPLKGLIQKKETLENNFLKDFYDFLNDILLQLENNAISLNKENEKIIKFKELLRDSKRNENILKILENAYQNKSIEQSKNKEPWKIISNPEVAKIPIYPNKRFIALSGMLFSLLIGSILSILIEYKSGKLYHKDDICIFLPFKFLKEISLDNIDQIKSLSENLEIMIRYKLQKGKKINLIPIGNIETSKLSKFVQNMNKFVTNDLFFNSMLNKSDIQNSVNILLVDKTNIKKNQILDFLENIKIVNANIEGFILIK